MEDVKIHGNDKQGYYISVGTYIVGTRRNARTWKTKDGAERFADKIRNKTADYRRF